MTCVFLSSLIAIKIERKMALHNSSQDLGTHLKHLKVRVIK